MKSKISCWRFVRSMWVLPGRARKMVRTCVREGSAAAGRNQTRAILRSPRPRAAATCAGGGIGRRARLRALWAEWPVEVRVLFGAWKKPRDRRGFLVPGTSVVSEALTDAEPLGLGQQGVAERDVRGRQPAMPEQDR